MSLIKAATLVLALFAFETKELVQQRWWLSYLPPSHLKFYELAIKTGVNNTFTVENSNPPTMKPNAAATNSTSKIAAPANAPAILPAILTTTTPNINTSLSPLEDEIIVDPLNILETLNSTGNNYFFNYFFCVQASAEANVESDAVDDATKVDNKEDSILQDCALVTKSGVYLVRVELYNQRPFMVYCQIIDDEKYGWLVIQQRDFSDRFIDFNRSWADYRAGFGVIDGSYWLGLEKIWAITHSMLNELVILLIDFDNNFRWYRYDLFSIADEEQNYTLISLGTRSGSAGDSLQDSEGQKFRTYDRDNEQKCAQKMRAGWWYKENCEVGNLNSPFSKDMTANYDGVMWPTLPTDQPLSTVKMMVRPKKYENS